MTHSGPDVPPVVLVVDYEPLVCMTAVDELEEAGFHVLEARSNEVQVLFTDVNMPGSMDDISLAEQVHQR
jgi:CheY-like chemotaxis protein